MSEIFEPLDSTKLLVSYEDGLREVTPAELRDEDMREACGDNVELYEAMKAAGMDVRQMRRDADSIFGAPISKSAADFYRSLGRK
jgi:hypothetical protein